jgi:hypothetical protein
MACSPSVVVGAEANSGGNADELYHKARIVEIAGLTSWVIQFFIYDPQACIRGCQACRLTCPVRDARTASVLITGQSYFGSWR